MKHIQCTESSPSIKIRGQHSQRSLFDNDRTYIHKENWCMGMVSFIFIVPYKVVKSIPTDKETWFQ